MGAGSDARRGRSAHGRRRHPEAADRGSGAPWAGGPAHFGRNHERFDGRGDHAGRAAGLSGRRADPFRRRKPHGHGDAPRRAAGDRGARARRTEGLRGPRDVSVHGAEVPRLLERGRAHGGLVSRDVALVQELGLPLELLPRHLPVRAEEPPAPVRDQHATGSHRGGAEEGFRRADGRGAGAHPGRRSTRTAPSTCASSRPLLPTTAFTPA